MMDPTLTSSASTEPRGRVAPAASWAAIFAGAATAVGLTFVLVALGSGLGLASVSPFAERGASATGFTIGAAIWLIVTQWLSSATGGYLAGRLRHRWHGTHVHEVFFRDTAHGLVTWAVATLALLSIAAGSLSSLAGGVTHVAATAASGAAQGAATAAADSSGTSSSPYEIDKLFRAPTPVSGAMTGAMTGPPVNSSIATNSGAASGGAASNGPVSAAGNGASGDGRAEVSHIAASIVTSGSLSDDDKSYLTALIASKTGVSPAEAQRRVDAFAASVTEAQTKAKAAADEARKAAAKVAIYAALSLLIGAFIASVAAAIGGRLRDEHL